MRNTLTGIKWIVIILNPLYNKKKKVLTVRNKRVNNFEINK